MQFGSTIVILLCDSIGQEMKKIRKRLLKLKRHSFSIQKKKEIKAVIDDCMGNTFPQFSAAGFFLLGRSTLLSILGTLATFLVIMVQFAGNKK